jgi:hypothetical protein
MRPRPASPASRLIHASVVVKMPEPTMPSMRRSTNHAAMLSVSFISMKSAMSRARQPSRKRRMPMRRTAPGVISGPTMTPMNVEAALRPLRVASVPRASSTSDSSGPPKPMPMPNTVALEIAAARLQRRSAALSSAGALSTGRLMARP